MGCINAAYSDSGGKSVFPRVAAKASALPRRLFDRLATWQERAASRRRLGQIDDWMLKDIGLTRADVARETAKPFWRP